MNKWYQTIIVNHKEEDGKTIHLLDDENYKILCNERAEQLKEIERLQEDIGNYVNIVLHDRKEIDRLNNIIEEIIKICEENEYLTLIKDIKRLKDSDK